MKSPFRDCDQFRTIVDSKSGKDSHAQAERSTGNRVRQVFIPADEAPPSESAIPHRQLTRAREENCAKLLDICETGNTLIFRTASTL